MNRLHPAALLSLILTINSSLAFSTTNRSIQNGVTHASVPSSSASSTILRMSNENEDPTKVWYASLANTIQDIVTNSPLNEFKKKIAQSLAGSYDQKAVRAELNSYISDEPVLMLSFVKCPFCIKAKAILDSKDVSYKVVELDEVENGPALRAEMADLIGRTSVPAIWIGSKFVGGCNDGPMGGIVKLEGSGELDSMLKNVGAI